MQKNTRKLNKFRKQVAELLEQFGYECYLKDGKGRKPFAFSNCRTPRVDEMAIEDDLKKFNKGEAYYYCENVGADLDYMTRCYQLDPEDTTPLYLKREEFYEYLLCGQEFRHLTPDDEEMMVQVDLLDQQKVERNTFRAVMNWKGLQENDFLWDFIISVNCMPLVAVVIEPTTPGNKPLQDALETLQKELEADKTLGTYLQFCIVSDGKHTLVGSASDPIQNYKPWNSLMGEENPKEDPLMPFLSMLRPDRLMNILLNYNRIMNITLEETASFLPDCHVFFGVEKALSAIQQMKVDEDSPQEVGHIRFIEAEENLSRSIFGGQATTSMQLLEDRLFLSDYLPEDMMVLQIPEEGSVEEMGGFQGGKFLFIIGPDVSYEFIVQLLENHPESKAIQIATAPLGPTLKRFIGSCLYSPTQIIPTYE